MLFLFSINFDVVLSAHAGCVGGCIATHKTLYLTNLAYRVLLYLLFTCSISEEFITVRLVLLTDYLPESSLTIFNVQ